MQQQRQANNQLKSGTTSSLDSKKSLSVEEQRELAAKQAKTTSPEASKPVDKTVEKKPAAETVKPKNTTPLKPSAPTTALPPPTWNIVHPNASTCTQSEFKVYSSVSSGTPYYNYYNRGAIVLGTLAYKQSKVVRCENSGFGPYNPTPGGPTGEWLEFGAVGVDGGEKFINLNDVSITAPPN